LLLHTVSQKTEDLVKYPIDPIPNLFCSISESL
jgi:hypothetical protein